MLSEKSWPCDGLMLGGDAALVADVAAAIDVGVAVQQFLDTSPAAGTPSR